MKISRYAFLLLLGSVVASLTTTGAQALAQTANKTPAVVYIIRHGEKPPAEDKSPDLAPKGRERASALPSLFVQQPGSASPRLQRPDALFATAAGKHSNREVETLEPLSQALHLSINHDFVNSDTAGLASEVLSGKYQGKVVLICWHHGELLNVAAALGVTNAPTKWQDTVFDQIVKIQWVDGKATLTMLPEALLPGDAAK